MTPMQLSASGTEQGHQRALMAWAAVAAQHGFSVAHLWAIGGVELKKAIASSPYKPVPELKWLHHIPNGGARGDDARSRAIRGNALIADGVRKGVSDLCLPVKRIVNTAEYGPIQYSGVYIELKKPGKLKTMSAEQKEFADFVIMQGFAFGCFDNWKDAANALENYLSNESPFNLPQRMN